MMILYVATNIMSNNADDNGDVAAPTKIGNDVASPTNYGKMYGQ